MLTGKKKIILTTAGCHAVLTHDRFYRESTDTRRVHSLFLWLQQKIQGKQISTARHMYVRDNNAAAIVGRFERFALAETTAQADTKANGKSSGHPVMRDVSLPFGPSVSVGATRQDATSTPHKPRIFLIYQVGTYMTCCCCCCRLFSVGTMNPVSCAKHASLTMKALTRASDIVILYVQGRIKLVLCSTFYSEHTAAAAAAAARSLQKPLELVHKNICTRRQESLALAEFDLLLL